MDVRDGVRVRDFPTIKKIFKCFSNVIFSPIEKSLQLITSSVFREQFKFIF